MLVECFRGRDSCVEAARSDMMFGLMFAVLLWRRLLGVLRLRMLGVVTVQ